MPHSNEKYEATCTSQVTRAIIYYLFIVMYDHSKFNRYNPHYPPQIYLNHCNHYVGRHRCALKVKQKNSALIYFMIPWESGSIVEKKKTIKLENVFSADGDRN